MQPRNRQGWRLKAAREKEKREAEIAAEEKRMTAEEKKREAEIAAEEKRMTAEEKKREADMAMERERREAEFAIEEDGYGGRENED